MSIEIRKAGTKKRTSDGLSYPNQNTIIINIICNIFTRNIKNYNEIQLTKNKMDLNNRKMTNHPRQRHRGRRKEKKSQYREITTEGRKKISPDGLTAARAYRFKERDKNKFHSV